MGHTADDQAETVLMRLLRGAGPTGLAGIPPVRGMIIRPLISVWREQILAYCRSCHLPFIEDASNRSDKYLRNRIRHHLVPYLEREYNPKVREALWRLAEVLRADEEYFDAEVAERYGSPQLAGEDGPGWAWVRAAGLRSLPLALQRRVLRHAYARATGRMAPSFERLEAALALAGPRACGEYSGVGRGRGRQKAWAVGRVARRSTRSRGQTPGGEGQMYLAAKHMTAGRLPLCRVTGYVIMA